MWRIYLYEVPEQLLKQSTFDNHTMRSYPYSVLIRHSLSANVDPVDFLELQGLGYFYEVQGYTQTTLWNEAKRALAVGGPG